MTIKEVHYVYTIYRERSFSQAAARLYMSQPALSTIVRRVERELGVRIFDRSTIPLTLTESGRVFIEAAQKIGDVDSDMLNRLQDIKSQQSGHLSIGGSSFFCSYVLSEKIGEFRNLFPGIRIDLYESNIDILKERIIANELDLIMETAIFPEDGLNTCQVREEEIILGVPKRYEINETLQNCRLTDQMIRKSSPDLPDVERVSLEHFKDLPFIFLRSGNDLYHRGMEMCRNAGFRPNIAIYLDQMLTAHNIAARGNECLFLRSWMLPYLTSTDTLYYYLIDDSLSRRPVYFAWKKGKYITVAMREFLKLNGVDLPE
ncbi:MAG: LysR family transcriptional regulator [Stomatobaculum sp.]|nr:LysR family transcriptional regulator [Stomatobaculum sp.]